MSNNNNAQPQQRQPKWEGKANAELASAKAEQVWPLLQDFFGLDKWFPTTCIPIEGISGQPSCVRFCAGFKTPVDGSSSDNKRAVNWTKQKLLSIDPSEMVLSYSIIDGNVGFKSYLATWKVFPKEGGGCEIEWKYEVEPVKGWRHEDLDSFVSSGLQGVAQRMEAALQLLQASMEQHNS